jgi:hypothetical protein
VYKLQHSPAAARERIRERNVRWSLKSPVSRYGSRFTRKRTHAFTTRRGSPLWPVLVCCMPHARPRHIHPSSDGKLHDVNVLNIPAAEASAFRRNGAAASRALWGELLQENVEPTNATCAPSLQKLTQSGEGAWPSPSRAGATTVICSGERKPGTTSSMPALVEGRSWPFAGQPIGKSSR